MGDQKIKVKNFNKLINKLQITGSHYISKNQSKKSLQLKEEIENLTTKLTSHKSIQNQCNSLFQEIEKTISDYKKISEERKNLRRTRITTVQNKLNHLQGITNLWATIFDRIEIYMSMINGDCILPD